MQPLVTGIAACRSCGCAELAPILSLGRTPLANSLLTREELDKPEATYPLDLAFCPACSLVQITESVPPEQLFCEYVYFSSFSDTMLSHAAKLAHELATERKLTPASLVVEVASNDGYLLQYYQQQGIPVLGIDPAVNVARAAAERGIPTLCDFFGRRLAHSLREAGTRANVVHAHNVLAHVPDLNGFVDGLRILLKDDGLALIEVPYVRDLVERCEFDTIYHEHLFYFSLHALQPLFERHGLVIDRVERTSIHGGSLRLYVVPKGARDRSSANSLLAEEKEWGVDRLERYERFRRQVAEITRKLRETLTALKSAGKTIAVYGASAKGSTLLNYLDMPKGTFEFVVDRSTVKQGRFTPGLHLPIHAPAKLCEARPDYALLLTWNFADEILQQQAEYRALGGRFIIPLPEVRVV